MSRAWRIAIVVGIQMICVGFVGHTLWEGRRELAGALDFAPLPLLGLLALNALGHVQRTVEFTYMLRRLGVQEPFREGFLLTGAGLLLNHLPLSAGFVMRAVVLQRDHALPYSSYLSLTLVNAVTNVAVAACIGLAGVFLSWHAGGSLSWPLFITLTMTLGSCALAVWFPRSVLPQGKGYLSRQLRNLADGVNLIRGNGHALLILIAIALFKTATLAVRLWFCFSVLHRFLSYFDAGLLAAIQNLTAIVNVTPGNIGLRELLVSTVSVELGASRSVGMAASSIDRIVNILYTLTIGLPGLYALRRRGPLGPAGDP